MPPRLWRGSSVGRAAAWKAVCHQFKSGSRHHKKIKSLIVIWGIFCNSGEYMIDWVCIIILKIWKLQVSVSVCSSDECDFFSLVWCSWLSDSRRQHDQHLLVYLRRRLILVSRDFSLDFLQLHYSSHHTRQHFLLLDSSMLVSSLLAIPSGLYLAPMSVRRSHDGSWHLSDSRSR